MSQETLMAIAGYGKFFIILFIFIIFYGYAYSIYKRQRTGEKDFEKYSDLVLNDALDSTPLEIRDRKIEKND